MQDVTSNQTPPAVDDWLLVEADELTWLIPRQEILHLGPLNRDPSPEGACGWVHHEEHDYPALYWNESLHLQAQAPSSCQSGVILHSAAGALALACHQLRKLNQPPNWQSLPPSMRGRRQAFDTIAVIAGRAAGKLTAEQLTAALPGLEPRPRAEQTHHNCTGTAS